MVGFVNVNTLTSQIPRLMHKAVMKSENGEGIYMGLGCNTNSLDHSSVRVKDLISVLQKLILICYNYRTVCT